MPPLPSSALSTLSDREAYPVTAPSRFLVLIPAYEPDETLVALVHEILSEGARTDAFAGVVIVDDGSARAEASAAFKAIEALENTHLITHDQNRGKGGALKTGFQHVLENRPDVAFVVTADADGQHRPADILKLAHAAVASGRANIGYRTFSNGVPLRSRLGNISTAATFRVAAGAKIHDTQSGLRTYLRKDLPQLIAIEADRYEYEFHCLFHMVRSLDQIPIETIYDPGNPTSHFNPLLDSARIYMVFFRYASVSVVSGFIDFVLFSVLTLFNMPVFKALLLARMGSAPFYFYGMRNIVFKSDGNILFQALGTIALMAAHIIFLWRFIHWLENQFGVHPIGAMLAGLLLFYVGNFLVQRFIIYPLKSGK